MEGLEMYKPKWDKSKYVKEPTWEDEWEAREAAADAQLHTLDEYQRYIKSIKLKPDTKAREVDQSWLKKGEFVALQKDDNASEGSTKTKKSGRKSKKPEVAVEVKKEEEQPVFDFSGLRRLTREQTPNIDNKADHLVKKDIRSRMSEADWKALDKAVQSNDGGKVGEIMRSHKFYGSEWVTQRKEWVPWTDQPNLDGYFTVAVKRAALAAFITLTTNQPYPRIPVEAATELIQRHKAKAQYYEFFGFLIREQVSGVIFSNFWRTAVDLQDWELFTMCCGEERMLYSCSRMTTEDIYHLDLFHVLCSKGLLKYAEKLLASFPSIDIDEPTWTLGDSNERRYHETPLMLAARNGHMNVVQWLLGKGAEVNRTDIWGKSASQIAQNPDIKALLKRKEDEYVAKFARVSGYSSLSESVDIKTKAIQRIMKDLKEVWDSPLPTVEAYPLETNVFIWHILLSAPPRNNAHDHSHYPFRGLKLHLILEFPEDYPRNPPKVKLSTPIPHPNVFGGYICLNMLQPPYYGSVDEETGNRRRYTNDAWSSGYSAYSIMLQLQAFLFDENVPQYGDRMRDNTNVSYWQRACAYQNALEFKCSECGYNIAFKGVDLAEADEYSALPSLFDPPEWEEDKCYEYMPSVLKNLDKKLAKLGTLIPIKRDFQPIKPYNGPPVILDLPDQPLLDIIDFLPEIQHISALMRTCRRFASLCHNYSVWTRRELLCFFSRRTWKEDIMGVGLYVERNASKSKIKTIRSPLDLLSRSAFLEDEVRDSAYQEPFHYWLPIVINQRHAEHALPLIKSIFVAIVNNISFEPKQRISDRERRRGPSCAELLEFEQKMEVLRTNFNPLIVLDIIPKLMNHMVVALMKTDTTGGILPLHDSEKALLGYCTYYHILLNLVKEFPVIQQKVDFFFKEFMTHPSRRVKKVIPDLGELLVHLSIASTETWESIAENFLQEFFDRTVVWTLDKASQNHGELAFLETDKVSDYRLRTTLEATRTSTRLLMFQVFFLRHVGRPKGMTLPQILKRFNDLYGRPQPGVPVMLQKECRKIHAVNSWPEFYRRIGLPVPSAEHVTHMLREAVRNSEKKGYHVNRLTQEELLVWRSKKDIMMTMFYDEMNPTIASVTPTTKTPDYKVLADVVTSSMEQPAALDDRKVWNSIPIGNKLVVRNLAWKTTEDDIKWVFKQFGDLAYVKIMRDDEGKSRGFAFVAFPSVDTAKVVVDYMNGSNLWDRQIEVRAFDDKPRPKPATTRAPLKEQKSYAVSEPQKPQAAADGFFEVQTRKPTTTPAAKKPTVSAPKSVAAPTKAAVAPSKGNNQKKAGGNAPKAKGNPFANLKSE